MEPNNVDNMSQYRRTFIDLLIGLAVGLTISVITKDVLLSSALGLLAFFLSEFIDLKTKIVRQTKQLERLNELWIGFLRPTDVISELAYEYGFKPSTMFSSDQVQVAKDDAWRFWRTCLLKTKTQWAVISYVDPDTWWKLGTIQPTLITQEERIRWGCHIERIFCLESESEIDSIKETISDQLRVGVDVGVITKEKLLENKLIAQYIQNLGTLDIALIDDRYVYRTLLNKKREIIGASISRDSKLIEEASYVIDQARALATREFSSIETG
jgi:hypothetical protein